MSHNLTEVSTFTATVQVPDDGDSRNAASVNLAFQALANRAKWLNAQLPANGAIVWEERVYMLGDSVIRISPIELLRLNGVQLSQAAATIDLTLLSLSGTTWYYVYGYSNGSGGITYEVSTTAPDSEHVFKTGDQSRRFITCFRTSAGAAPIPFRKHGHKYAYLLSYVSYTGDLIVGTTSSSYASQNLAAVVPPHSRRVFGLMQAVDVRGGGVVTFSIRTPSTTSDELNVDFSNSQATLGANSPRTPFELECSSVQAVEMKLTVTAAGTGTATFYAEVNGFYE